MAVTGADLSQWVAHRRAVVLTVSRRVPGIDPEPAVSRGLELLCAQLREQGHVCDPLAFWSAAAVDAALRMAHEQALPTDLPAGPAMVTAPVRRALDLELLSTAMDRLPAGEQRLLWEHHVESPSAAGGETGMLPRAAARRLRRAENRLAYSLAETHAAATDDRECRTTRASMHDLVRHRLLPRRRREVEDHMVRCAGCARAFTDVRESYWMLRAAAPALLLGAATAAKAGTAAGAAGAASGTAFGGLSTLAGRAILAVRAALTDPVGLTATVAGSLFITTAVTTGAADDAGAVPSFFETGTVSVAAADSTGAVVRRAAPAPLDHGSSDVARPSRATPTGLRAGEGRTSEELVTPTPVAPPPAGPTALPPLAKDGEPPRPDQPPPDHSPPGEVKKDGNPGQAKTEGIPPGLTKGDGTPPGQAKKDGTPPGLSDGHGRPHRGQGGPGQGAGQKDVGQKDVGPAGSDEGRNHRGTNDRLDSTGTNRDERPGNGVERHDGSGHPGSRGAPEPEDPAEHEHDHGHEHGGGHSQGPGRSGQARSRSTSTS